MAGPYRLDPGIDCQESLGTVNRHGLILPVQPRFL